MLFFILVVDIQTQPSTQFNMSSSANNTCNTSLYIPRIDTRSLPRWNRYSSSAEWEDACKEFVGRQFELQKIGKVHRVDLITKQTPDGYQFFIGFIHFESMFLDHSSGAARNLMDQIDGSDKAKFYYHEKYYWIVNLNRRPVSDRKAQLQEQIYRTQMAYQQQLAALNQQMAQLSTQMAEDVLCEDEPVAAGCLPSPRKKARQTTMSDWVEHAQNQQYDHSFQPDVEAGIVERSDDTEALETAIDEGTVATHRGAPKKLQLKVTSDDEDESPELMRTMSIA